MTTTLPRVTPVVLKRRAAAFDNPDRLFELKYDGFRALLEVDRSGARLVSRNRNRFKHLDTLATALAKRPRVKDAILDGEIICADDDGTANLPRDAAGSPSRVLHCLRSSLAERRGSAP